MKILNDKEKFSEDKILKFINEKLENKIDINDFQKIMNLANTIAQLQKVDLSEIEYQGSGQSYVVLSIGNYVMKIGPQLNFVQNPFQILPFHQESLENSKQKIYLCQRCNSDHISEEDVQKMYNYIRENDGIWIDPKKTNLGIKEGKLNISFFIKNVDYYNTQIEFDNYNGNIFITDFEDVVFLTRKLISENMDQSNRWIKLPYGKLEGGVLGNRIFVDDANSIDINDIYEKNFIMRSQTLLKFEEQYQLQKGNKQLAKKYKHRRNELINQAKQERYRMKQVYENGRNNYSIGNRYSAKEIGIQIMQKTNLTRIKDIINAINQRFAKNKKQVNIDHTVLSEYKEDKTDNANNRDIDPFATENAR